MNYINEQFDRLIQTEENRRIIEDMRRDVDSFLPNFSDSQIGRASCRDRVLAGV